MDTSRKIPQEEILLLDELEIELKKKGIQTTQKELLRKSIRFFVEHKPLWEPELRSKKDNTSEMVKKFLSNAKKFDFGKNWMEEIDTSL
ncbi:hypothetical protein HYU14_07370 [Candidatus Woesearchaeota archaeon]|nr:hypothetical protein [Candidatus Woesearchaeota archaeon]